MFFSLVPKCRIKLMRMTTGSFHADTSTWPIVVYTSTGQMRSEHTVQLLTALDASMHRKQRHVAIFDSTKLTTFAMPDRDRIVKWMKDNDAALRAYSVGTGVVLSSAALRFVISTVLLVYAPPMPIKVYASVDEARAWAKSILAGDSKRPSPATA